VCKKVKERIIVKFIREIKSNYVLMEKENKQENERDDLDKIMALYRIAISKWDSKELEEKKSMRLDKTAPTEILPVRKEELAPTFSKRTEKDTVTSEETEKFFEWIKVVESAIQNCISQSKGSISSISVLLPDDVTCLSFGSRIDMDEDVLAAFIGEQFELFESYGGVLKMGEIEEIEYTGKQGVILMKSGGGLRLMALMNDKRYVRLAKIYLERMLKSIPRLE
jgi:predicted regulator of Ras-like GTPase activity (Roadblock/LC7/MglB family)